MFVLTSCDDDIHLANMIGELGVETHDAIMLNGQSREDLVVAKFKRSKNRSCSDILRTAEFWNQ